MRNILLVVLALIVAAGTAFAIREKISAASGGTRVQLPMNSRNVLVATVEIPAGSFIRVEKHFTWKAIPGGDVLPEHIQEAQGLRLEEYNGAVVRQTMRAGEAINSSYLVKPDDGGFLQAVLGEGQRAVSIAVNEISGNAGFIFPGDRVDMILTHSVGGSSDKGGSGFVSETFVENARVLAVDQRYKNSEAKVLVARTVTLEVTPKQAEMINVASQLGRISLSLRSLNPNTIANDATHDEGMTLESDVSRLLREVKGGRNVKVNISRGTEREEMLFKKGGQP